MTRYETGLSEIIFIDDNETCLRTGRQAFELAGLPVIAISSPEEAVAYFSCHWPGVVVTDIRMPRMSGLDVMKAAHIIDSDIPVILVTGHGDIPMAVDAIRAGAFDFLEKPYKLNQLIDTTRRALEARQATLENRSHRSELATPESQRYNIIGKSAATEQLRKLVAYIASMDVDVLLMGETGSGKELVARSLHEQSPRSRGAFVAINCGSLPESIIENELFGHEAGAFTGARDKRIGRFEYASGGTILLDEVESMPLELQVKLLRVLQEREIDRLGSNKPISIDVRVIAASKSNLRKASDEGTFRKDLYYRLNVAQISIPPLRDRLDDVPLLFKYFLSQACIRHKLEIPEIEKPLHDLLLRKMWAGNVRELRNVAERFALGLEPVFDDDEETPDTALPKDATQPETLSDKVAELERHEIETELACHNGNITNTYLALGIPRKTLYEKMKCYNIQRADYLLSNKKKS